MKTELTIEEVTQFLAVKTSDEFKIQLITNLIDSLDSVESVDKIYETAKDVYETEHEIERENEDED